MSAAERWGHSLTVLLGLVSVVAVLHLREPDGVSAPLIGRAAGPSKSARPVATAEHGGIVARLVDRLGEAAVDAPELARVDQNLSYWRRMRSPWAGPSSEVGRAVQQVAIVRAGAKGPTRQAGGWVPDPRVWNMDEGSYEQRESILAPPPATLRFPGLAIPAGARLEVAPAIAGPGRGGVDFQVAVRADGQRSVLGEKLVEGGEFRGFEEWRLDLAPWAGKTVELELVTRAHQPGAESAAALWGTPVIIAPNASDFPFNVLFVVVDALRADALSATHDPETDARMAKADPPPLDAWLPNLPEVAPNLDALAKRGVLFTEAHSAGTWTRPGTLGLLAGALSSDLGMAALPLIPPPGQVRALYASKPPFLPLVLRERGVDTRAVVNNFYMIGYAGVGVDMGFEALVDHRYAREDTREILRDAQAYLEAHGRERFCLFVNFVSPHVPFAPPASAKAAIPEPPRGPSDRLVAAYLAEIHKDDAAIGELVAKLDALGLSKDTLIVITADHGETLSAAHDAVPEGVDGGPAIGGRFHHLSSLYDETAHVPLLMILPERLPAARRVAGPVSTIDILPTVLDLAGLPARPDVRGASLMPRIRGESEPDRVVVTEGRGAHALRVGRYRLVLRDAGYRHVHEKGRRSERPIELYDLQTDPGERVDIHEREPEVVQRLMELDRARRAAPAAGAPVRGADRPVLHLRFASAGQRKHLAGWVALARGAPGALAVVPIGLGPEAAVLREGRVVVDAQTSADAVVGIDLSADPAADLEWHFTLDDAPIAADRVFAGAYGLVAPALAAGLRGDTARRAAAADALPWIDAERELGLFIARDVAAQELELTPRDAAKEEAMDLMRAWGYVRSR